jgi:hypothetical protein
VPHIEQPDGFVDRLMDAVGEGSTARATRTEALR